MRRLVIRSLLLLALVALVLLPGIFWPELRWRFANGTTDSDLFSFPKDAHEDLVILGTSHAKAFSLGGNHARIERILGASILNLGKSGMGPRVERLFFDYFFARGNRTDTVVYLIDPWALYSDTGNVTDNIFSREPLKAEFLTFLMKQGVQGGVLLNYVTSKATPDWWLQKPDMTSEEIHQTTAPDAARIKKNFASRYQEGLSPVTFARYAEDLHKIAETAKEHGARMIFIIPPTLVGDLPGEEALKAELKGLHDDFGVEWYDHSGVVLDPKLYFDDDHLNTAGVQEYTRNELKPILDRACVGR